MAETISEQLAIAQYEALREEVLRRLDLRQQLLTFTMLVAGSFFGLGLQSWVSGLTVLCYPLIALFLAGAWTQHDRRIGQIAVYLRSFEDAYLSRYGPGWETQRRTTLPTKVHRLTSGLIVIPARGVFLSSQALALLVGIARYVQEPSSMIALFLVLIGADVLVMVGTWYVLKHHRER